MNDLMPWMGVIVSATFIAAMSMFTLNKLADNRSNPKPKPKPKPEPVKKDGLTAGEWIELYQHPAVTANRFLVKVDTTGVRIAFGDTHPKTFGNDIHTCITLNHNDARALRDVIDDLL